VADDAGVKLEVARDAAAAGKGLEIYVGAAPVAGKSTPPLVVELPAGADKVTATLSADYAGATLGVLDASPFLRACPGTPGNTAGCVLQVGAGSAASSAGAASSVSIDKLHRLTGDPMIPPTPDVVAAGGGGPLASAIVKLCLDPRARSRRPRSSSRAACRRTTNSCRRR